MKCSAKIHTRQITHWLFLYLLIMSLQGCVSLAKETFSEPDHDGFEEKGRSILQFKEIGFVLHGAYHDHCTGRLAFVGILLPVIPMPCLEPQYIPQHFEIGLIILPQEKEFSIDLRQVKTNINGEIHSPTKITIAGSPSSQITTYHRRNPVPFCEGHENRKTYNKFEFETQLVDPLPIPNGACVWLTFSSLPTQLQDPFIIKINGLTKKNSPYPIPPFSATPKTQWYFSIMRN